MKRLTPPLLLISAALLLGACGEPVRPNAPEYVGPVVEVTWDRSPSTLIFQADTFSGSLPYQGFNENRIPDCSLYGDGTLIWVRPSEVGEEVLTATVADSDIEAFLQEVVDQGFFGWGSRVEAGLPAEGTPTQILTAHFGGYHYVVQRTDTVPTDAFEALYRRCIEIGGEGAPYVPDGAWLSASLVEPAVSYAVSLPDTFDLDLAALVDSGPGRWVTGAVLTEVWNVVHLQNAGAVAQQGDAQYRLILRIPNLTFNAPSAPTTAIPSPVTPTPED